MGMLKWQYENDDGKVVTGRTAVCDNCIKKTLHELIILIKEDNLCMDCFWDEANVL
jgi:hypothetical protein